MYIHMLGYPTHFGQMETLKLIAASGFPEKVHNQVSTQSWHTALQKFAPNTGWNHTCGPQPVITLCAEDWVPWAHDFAR